MLVVINEHPIDIGTNFFYYNTLLQDTKYFHYDKYIYFEPQMNVHVYREGNQFAGD